jgi:hypothetical protein
MGTVFTVHDHILRRSLRGPGSDADEALEGAMQLTGAYDEVAGPSNVVLLRTDTRIANLTSVLRVAAGLMRMDAKALRASGALS